MVRWGFTLTWTTIILVLTLTPSGSGTTVSSVSGLFGGTETTDAIGHVILNVIWVLLWCWTINLYIAASQMIRIVLGCGIVWGIGAELAQHFVPHRGVSLIDLSANLLGLGIGLVIYRRLSQASHQTPPPV
jgi:MFS superfamily sulfate permease-like transporter